MEEQQRARAGWYVLLFVGIAGVAGAITLLFHVMSAVMEIGGACGSGGPYVTRAECPSGVGPSVLLSIFGGILAVGLTLAASARLGAPPIVLLGWPALFGLLGANFLRYGFDPPDGSGAEVGWLITGFVFELMAIGPLWFGVSMLRDRWLERRARSAAPSVASVSTVRYTWNVPPSSTTMPTSPTGSTTSAFDDHDDLDGGDGGDGGGGLVDALQQLADLHRRGDLTDAEFAAAKRALLSGER